MSLKNLILREIRARKDFLVGTVVSSPVLRTFDASAFGAETWVVRVDVGGNRILDNVPVKAVEGSRFYAQLGQSVLLRKNAQGRYDVVGPADRLATAAVAKQYDLNAGLLTATETRGFTFQREPFEFYGGSKALKGNPALTFNQIASADDELFRSAGSWTDDGFAAGDDVLISKSLKNDGTFTIASIPSPDTLRFAGDVLVDEGPISGVGVVVPGTSRWNDGVTPFPLVRVLDGSGNQV